MIRPGTTKIIPATLEKTAEHHRTTQMSINTKQYGLSDSLTYTLNSPNLWYDWPLSLPLFSSCIPRHKDPCHTNRPTTLPPTHLLLMYATQLRVSNINECVTSYATVYYAVIISAAKLSRKTSAW